MGRKKNLEALGARRDYLKNKVAGMADTDTFKDVFEGELEALEWALKKLEAEGIGAGDRVTIPDDVDSYETGVVVSITQGGYLVRPDTGHFSGSLAGLWYSTKEVTLADE